MSRSLLAEEDRRRIAAAIRDVERQTSGELVTVVARASDGYAAFPLLAAALLALLAPPVAWIAAPTLDHLDVYAIQLGVFIAIAAPTLWRPLRMRLVPPAVKRRQARRLAREQFHALGLDQTGGRTGILLFVSVAERYVEILADRAIDEKVPPGTWKEIVAAFTRQVRDRKIADGFVGALTACGALLISHFPRADDDKNELPDVLIEL
jgi:putative membrane protein